MSVLHGVKTRGKVLKRFKETNLGDVEKLLQETHRATAYQEVG
jgi:hypothetical protein